MPLLTTKFYVPRPRPELVLRPRLFEQLNTGLQRKLTLISAPAGFGKTMLLAAWLHQQEDNYLPSSQPAVPAEMRYSIAQIDDFIIRSPTAPTADRDSPSLKICLMTAPPPPCTVSKCANAARLNTIILSTGAFTRSPTPARSAAHSFHWLMHGGIVSIPKTRLWKPASY